MRAAGGRRGDAVQVADLALEAAGRVGDARPGWGSQASSRGTRSTSSTRWSSARRHEHVDDPEASSSSMAADQCDAGARRRSRRLHGVAAVRRARTSCDVGAARASAPRTAAASARIAERTGGEAAVRAIATTRGTPSASARGSRGPCADRSGAARRWPSAPRRASSPRCAGRGRRRRRAAARRPPPSPTSARRCQPATTMADLGEEQAERREPEQGGHPDQEGRPTPGRRASRPRTSSIAVVPSAARIRPDDHEQCWTWPARGRARAAAPRSGRATPPTAAASASSPMCSMLE